MPNLNTVMLMGNLTRDPELKYTPKGTAVADISLAINRTWSADGQKQEETTFVDITLFGKVAEIVHQYAGKGKPLFVEGRLQLDTWDDKQTGQKRSKLKVIGENIQLLGAKGDGDAPPRQQQQRREEPRNMSVPSNRQDDFDDVPFS